MFKNFNITESKKLQFRFNAYNFLNHPLWSFNGSNLNLGFNPNGTISTPLFGTVTTKQGHRVVQAAVKFYFLVMRHLATRGPLFWPTLLSEHWEQRLRAPDLVFGNLRRPGAAPRDLLSGGELGGAKSLQAYVAARET